MKKPSTHNPPVIYQNNPFMVALDGLNLLFKLAMPVAIFTIVLVCLSFFANNASTVSDISDLNKDEATQQQEEERFKEEIQTLLNHITSQPPEFYATLAGIALLIIIGVTVISTLISGVLDYTASRLAKNEPVTMNEAALAVMNRFFPYLWLQILLGIKIFLWTLLLIIPGIIMSVRYTLSGTVFFSEKTSANAATKRSSQLVKGAWLTTFASHSLFNLITFGIISPMLTPGTNAVLYRQLVASGDKKPAAHVLSWITLMIPIALLIMGILLALMLIAVVVNFTHISNP